MERCGDIDYGFESNNPILGKIPTKGGGLCKTYQESKILLIDYDDKYMVLNALRNDDKREKLYLDKETDSVVLESKRDLEENNISKRYKEVELLGILPYGGTSQYGSHYFNFIIEVIEKDVLLAHLREERALLEEQKENSLRLK